VKKVIGKCVVCRRHWCKLYGKSDAGGRFTGLQGVGVTTIDIESLIVGRDEVVRGANVRVMTKGNPVYLNSPVQKLYPVQLNENGSITEERKDNKVEN
jgi:hypothetical protein